MTTVRVIMFPEVIDYFLELAEILYEKGYFGFEESAEEYVGSLFEDIRDNLPNRGRKVAPKYFDKYEFGMFYSVFKANKNTSWYVFFNVYPKSSETIFLVRYINNNHMIAQYL